MKSIMTNADATGKFIRRWTIIRPMQFDEKWLAAYFGKLAALAQKCSYLMHLNK